MRTSSAQILADKLKVTKRSIENYAKEATELGIKTKEGRDNYLPIGLMEFFYRKWKDAESQVKNNSEVDEERLKNYRIKNFEKLMEIDERAGRLAPVENVRLVMSYFTSTTHSSLDQLMNNVIVELKAFINNETEEKLRKFFNETKELLGKLKVDDKLTRDESLLDEDFILTSEEETK